MDLHAPEDPAAVVNAGHAVSDGFPLPAPDNIIPRPLTSEEEARIDTLSRLQFFLATAPTRWTDVSQTSSRITKFQLPNSECISCILWNGLYHITGTDIVRALAFRFEAFGRPIHATKKWEEGVFSDLRNLKPGQDACLEEPKSPLLDFLFRNGCIRTQKKQKVFYWFSVPHDRLFLDALERDLKREKVNQEPTSIVVGEPARSFKYDPRRSLYDQFAGQNPGLGSNYFPSQPQPMAMPEYGAPLPQPHDPYYGGPPPMPLSLQPPPHAAGPSMGGMPPHGYPGPPPPPGYHPSYPPPGMIHGQPLPHPGPHGPPMGMGMGMPPHMRNAMSPAPHHPPPMHMGPPGLRGPPGHAGFRPSAPLEGSPHYKRRRSRISRSPAVRTSMGGHDEEGTPADDSFASEESAGVPHKKPRSVSRAASVAASGITGRSGSVDSAGELRMYPCPYSNCRRPFRRLEHLRRHVRTHTQEKPFWCTRCPKKFARQDNLTNHLRVHDKHDGSGAEGGDGEYDMDASEYEEEEGMNVAALQREWSASPAEVMSRNVSGSSVGGMSYNRHSTLPPKFPPNFAMYNPGLPSAAGAGVTATPGPIDYQPYQPGAGMTATSSHGSMYGNNLGMGAAPLDPRRHRSATPYAPVTSSNLAYAPPVTSGEWSSETAYAAAPPPPDFGGSADMNASTSGSAMGYPPAAVDNSYHRSVSIDPAHLQAMPADGAVLETSNGFALPGTGNNGTEFLPHVSVVPPGPGPYVTDPAPLKTDSGVYVPPPPNSHLQPVHLQHSHQPQHQQLHISVPTPTTAGTLMPTTAATGISVADSLLPFSAVGNGHAHGHANGNDNGNGNVKGLTIGVPANGDGIAKAPVSASKVPSGWGWKTAPQGTRAE